MAHGLAPYFRHVHCSDIHDHGSSLQAGRVLDFLADEADAYVDAADWIVTNPPFAQAQAFVEAGLRRAARGVAVLCRLAWFETDGRFPLFFPSAHCGLTVYAPFFERVCMTLGGWDPKGSTATAYAWFVFQRPGFEPAWLVEARAALGSCAVTLPITPGTKDRLTYRDDARLFGRRAALPLFDPPSPDAEGGEAAKPACGHSECIALGDGGEGA